MMPDYMTLYYKFQTEQFSLTNFLPCENIVSVPLFMAWNSPMQVYVLRHVAVQYTIGAWMIVTTTNLCTNESIVFLVQWSHVTMNIIITTH